MSRRINKEGLELIKRWEGLRLTAYQCPAGEWTIGYGHTSAAGYPQVTKGMTITQEDAECILRTDLRQYEQAVEQAVTVDLTDEQFAALVSLTFNIGPGNFRKSTLLKKLNAGDYTAAQEQFAVWRKSGRKVLQGLVNRRAQEAALFGRGEFVTSNHIKTKPAADPVMTKENVTWGAGIAASLTGVLSGNGSVQDALAIVILASFTIGAALFIWKRVKAG